MAKNKKQPEKQNKDIKVEKPIFKNTLAAMIKKKPDKGFTNEIKKP
jgi:hypothetical protein